MVALLLLPVSLGLSPLASGRVRIVGQGGRAPAGYLRVDLSRTGRHPELATPFTTGRARELRCFDRRGHHGGCACATEAVMAAYVMWGEGDGNAAWERAAATRGTASTGPRRRGKRAPARVASLRPPTRSWTTRPMGSGRHGRRRFANWHRGSGMARILRCCAQGGLSPVTAIC